METIKQLLDLQAGVISRRQVVARGMSDDDITRMLRRREWATLHRGVYINHTGDPDWLPRAWAAVLFSWPAALSHGSALRAAEGPGRHGDLDAGPIQVVVARQRHVSAPEGVRVHRTIDLQTRVQWNRSPPRVRYEEAALDVAASAVTDFSAVAVLARAVQSRRTTARRMLASLESRTRIGRRDWIEGVLRDVAEGTCSVLEHGFLNLVERPHRLPRAERQKLAAGRVGRIYRDAAYGDFLDVELDSRLFHDTAEARDRDMDRDLLALAGGEVTARLSYGQVFGRPCWTADQVARVLVHRGWTGSAIACGPQCDVRGGLQARGA